MAKDKPFLIDSALAITAITAFLYSASTAKQGGFMSLLGLDADLLSTNFQQTLYRGFLLSFFPLLNLILIYAGVSAFFTLLGIPAIQRYLKKTYARKRRFLVYKHSIVGRNASTFERRIAQHLGKVFTAVFVVFALLFAFVYFEAEGKKQAVELLQHIDNRDVDPGQMINVAIDGKEMTLVYLWCGERNCAGLDLSTRLVHYFEFKNHSFRLPETARLVKK